MSYLSMIARRTLPELPQSQLIIRDMIPTSQESFHYLYESYIQNILVLQGSFDDYDVEVAKSLRYLHNPIIEFEEES
ncbi:hypothetical protein BKA69DRAFT_1047111 [Paraphysoderma sedebokerense]|nr:hypothetical protein BKA69DRAFT_1047111 [Paraphysoderma sedebokerense]